jgi:RHS repeat-associated protein
MGGGIGSILYSDRGATREHFTYNAVGHTVALTLQSGAVAKTDLYEAYGNIVASTGSSSNNRLANTKERSFTLGLDNHGFRYYDPEIGRYIGRDPIGYGDGLNVYLYVHNNPINRVDPLGLADHHKIPEELWAGFSDEAREFLNGGDAIVKTIDHNRTRHQFYTETVRDEINAYLAKNPGIDKTKMTAEQAKKMLAHVEQNKFVRGFNKAAVDGPEGVKKWLHQEEGYKLLADKYKDRAAKYEKKYLKELIRKGGREAAVVVEKYGAVALLALDATLTARRVAIMRKEGKTDAEINLYIMDNYSLGLASSANAFYDSLVDNMVNYASRDAAFMWLDDASLNQHLEQSAGRPSPDVDAWSNSGSPKYDPKGTGPLRVGDLHNW